MFAVWRLNGDQPSIEKQNLCFRRTSFRRFHRRVNEGRVSYPRGPARLSRASGNTGLGFLTVVQGLTIPLHPQLERELLKNAGMAMRQCSPHCPKETRAESTG
jgi:hypothetical protein